MPVPEHQNQSSKPAQTEETSHAVEPAGIEPAGTEPAGTEPAPGTPSPKKPLSFYVACVVALVAVVLACVLGYQAFSNTSEERDPNASLGQLEGKSQEEIQAELDRIVEEGMLKISIPSVVEFADGTAEGELAIENAPNNHYLMKVEITRDDTNETIFSSGFIEPNHHIKYAKLSTDLDAGTYACTATFSGYDTETEALVGQAGANITVIVRG